jgi:hypothetical protein
MSRKAGFSLPAIAEQLPAFRTGRLGIGQMVEALQDRITAAGLDQRDGVTCPLPPYQSKVEVRVQG